jgi:hypothetical protein
MKRKVRLRTVAKLESEIGRSTVSQQGRTVVRPPAGRFDARSPSLGEIRHRHHLLDAYDLEGALRTSKVIEPSQVPIPRMLLREP